MITIEYFMSPGSPWSFLGHKHFIEIVNRFNVNVNMYPVNYGEIFPLSGGVPVSKRPIQRQSIRLQELKRWGDFLKISLNPEPKFFPSKSLLPSLIIIASQLKKTNQAFDLANNIMSALWVENLNIDDEDTLINILKKMDLDADEILNYAKTKECEDAMKSGTRLAIEKGVFGAPTYIVNDQIYWGQDRLDFVERHLSSLLKP
ncbi:MAG: 2-hydroxychromene-2-carboxylate isomerase [Proteobacteria bacterium]|nr:2-hydroxychromene-2-carboxylate isomerase [Pseudomonadota bacterium]MDA1135237.1 2-hydroxychromene-2-carboxylate isomerase [Pseudomonadota bacterium]